MRYGEVGATSIDLTVRDLVEHRPAGIDCTVATSHSGEAFPGHQIVRISETSTRQKVRDIAAHLRAKRYDVIVVQQHLPTAAKLAAVVDVPVILHTHNFQKAGPRIGPLSWARRQFRLSRYQQLAGVIHVSEACRARFRVHWPEFLGAQAVVYNGLDMRAWHPSATRKRIVMCAARNVPEKGVLPAAHAMREVIEKRRDWRALFILSETALGDAYARHTLATLGGHDRIKVLLDQPHRVVKAACETSAIALVPSVWEEPFGRTALEGHAGGCAVVTSGSGGLAEVSAGYATVLPEVTPGAIATAVDRLIEDEPRRIALAQAGRAHVAGAFDIDEVSRQFFSFCDVVMTRSVPRDGVATLWGSCKKLARSV